MTMHGAKNNKTKPKSQMKIHGAKNITKPNSQMRIHGGKHITKPN